MKTKKNYTTPEVTITRVKLEEGIVQAPVSVRVVLHDWEEGGELGNDPADGGDVYLIY